jgi:hypothetical protein
MLFNYELALFKNMLKQILALGKLKTCELKTSPILIDD